MSDLNTAGPVDFKAIFEAAPDAVVVHDLNNCVLFWNQAAEELYGWSAEEIHGRPITRILYLDRNEREEAMTVLKNGGMWQRELRQLDRNGDEYLVLVRQHLQRCVDGLPQAIVSFNTDVTEQRKLADAQERAHHVRSSSILAGGVAHELNNALAPIMLSSAMLRRSVEGEKAQSMVSMIEKCATKGAALIADLLAFERGKGGGNEIIRVTQIKRGILRACEELVGESIKLQVNINEDLWECRGELSEICSVFQYVIQNACEAMPDGGELTIDVQNRLYDENFENLAPEAKAGAYISFVFTDTGTGIAPEALAHVAEPFFTTKAPTQGFGFGLSNTQATIKGHKGFMVIESRCGVGTSVSIFLPADADSALKVDHVEPYRDPKSGEGELVLVADDEMFVRETIKRTLEDRGYQVIAAQDGTEALAIYSSRLQDIDMVVTNIEMPYMDGPALCRALKKLNPEVKILVSSGHKQAERVQAIQSCGVKEFLAKPYTADSLADRVYSILAGESSQPA
ncbi:response regulator [Coraliomargarita algicola]|uniref:histidine kinase n=1 Tax=Coraliomargarita algicola TaxID=3092156 RepID=A0ABZ0RKB6_9BACT|nr:response regulator [Coraliomargarita sp. J2-16]WPJ95601.1 response regulator [Coraliomargarita sp. J2-16]